jgi:DNA-binding MarR family transcriptional regulator
MLPRNKVRGNTKNSHLHLISWLLTRLLAVVKLLPLWNNSRMEIGRMTVSTQIVEQYMELLQRFIGLRVDLMLPEHMVRFKQQMENSRGGAGSIEDYTFLFRIFTLLAQSETPPTMSELSAHLNLPFSSTTRLIDWLERARFVERIHDANDRRVVRVHMTANGEQLYQISMDHNKQQIARLLKDFSATEQAQLLRLMNKLLDAFNAGE